MQLLEQRILAEGEVKSSEILKVDRFLNHQMDPKLFLAMAEEWKRLFDGCGVNKLVTIEASGIGIAAVAGLVFDCPVVFAKKTKSRNVSDDAYTTVVHSFTHGNDNTIRISREYLSPDDRVLVIDDFLANGAALDGLITLIEGAGATVVGAGIAVERRFSPAVRASARAATAWNRSPACRAWTPRPASCSAERRCANRRGKCFKSMKFAHFDG